MKTIVLSAALIGFSALAASACDYGNTSAKADSKITVASIEQARKSLPTTAAPTTQADDKSATEQDQAPDQD